MPRQDLLALTVEDLAAMTNRGTVKRAQRELEAGEPIATITESDKSLQIEWSDGIVCEFPAGGTVDDASCSSGAVGISRHVVRSVLAYQVHVQSGAADEATSETGEQSPSTPAQPWDPGEISDDELIGRFGKRAVANARRRFDEGVLAELIRGVKPYARFLDRPCVVRFLVPGDVRYVHSDCAESSLSEFVCHAVWVFRELDPQAHHGIVSTRTVSASVPTTVLDQIEELVAELCLDGIGHLSPTWQARASRCEQACRDAGLVWPAELIADITEQAAAYRKHDSLFDPLDLTRFVGELLIRCDAIRSEQTAVPRLLVQGSASDRTTELAGARLIGVGCDARTGAGTTTITAYLQDSDTGVMMACSRTTTDRDDDEPGPYHKLADAVFYKGFSLSQFGGGQLLIKSGKRTAGHQLTLPRTAGTVTVNRQSYAWEHLRPPHFVENFAEIRSRLELLPPASLRPRRPTENIFVCPVRGVADVSFDSVGQQLTGCLRDGDGETALLRHRYTSRGQPGFELLANRLSEHGDDVCFVSGQMSLSPQGVIVRPLTVVFESSEGRQSVQPWIDSIEVVPAAADLTGAFDGSPAPIADFRTRWAAAAADLLVTGIRQADLVTARTWQELTNDAATVGFVRVVTCIRAFAGRLDQHVQTLRGDARPVAPLLSSQLVLLGLTNDLST